MLMSLAAESTTTKVSVVAVSDYAQRADKSNGRVGHSIANKGR